jgi:hypothetical protein
MKDNNGLALLRKYKYPSRPVTIAGYIGLALTAVLTLTIGKSIAIVVCPGPSILFIAAGYAIRAVANYDETLLKRPSVWLVGAIWFAVVLVGGWLFLAWSMS